jgi:tRNA (cytidine32/uridine32-2'-O)-methyltransferase
MHKNIRIVLVATSHPGNIGAVARAMKTMGLTNLYLVEPKTFPHVDATARAAGADDILAHAVIVSSLEQAIASCNLVIGTSARTRAISLPILEPKAAAQKIISAAPTQNIALIFGRENNGLANEELQLCNYQLHIPSNPDFSSLNLAAAVQIVAYEIRMAQLLQCATQDPVVELATAQDMQFFYQHLQQILQTIKFLDPANPRKLVARLQRLFNRAQLEKVEVSILRGILTAIEKHL